MTSFQAKMGWERPKKRKIKNFFPFPSDRTCSRKYQKNEKKIQTNQKIPLWLHFKPKQVGKGREIEKIKNVVPFRSFPTRNRKFQKNSKKFQKIKKPCYGFFSSQNRLEKSEKERK